MLNVGDKAPDFKLTTLGADGPEHVTLSGSTAENVTLLLFVPMAFTGVCTEELCDITNSINEYDSLGAKVIAISGDNPFAQAAWAEKEGIKLTLASDYEHEVAKAAQVGEHFEQGGARFRILFARLDRGGRLLELGALNLF